VGETCGTHGGGISVGSPKGKRPLERYRRMWEDIIKMELREIDIVRKTGFCWLKIGSSGVLL